jgi:hypothetical protein
MNKPTLTPEARAYLQAIRAIPSKKRADASRKNGKQPKSVKPSGRPTNAARVKRYLAEHPQASAGAIAAALNISAERVAALLKEME